MRYLPTINVDNALCEALHRGQLRLQPGQWIKLAWSDRKSRWVGLTPDGTIWARHWTGKHDPKAFTNLCRNFRTSFPLEG